MPGCGDFLCCRGKPSEKYESSSGEKDKASSQKLVKEADSQATSQVTSNTKTSVSEAATSGQKSETSCTNTQVNPDDSLEKIQQVKSTIEKQGAVTVIKIEQHSPTRPLTVFNPTRRFTTPAQQQKVEEHQKQDDKIKMATEQLSGLLERLESITTRLEKIETTGGASGGDSSSSTGPAAFVVEFDKLISGPVAQLVAQGKELGDANLTKQLTLLCDGFKRQRAFLDVASRSKTPAKNVLEKLVEPVGACIKDIQDVREQNRKSAFFNHLSAIAESVPAFGWIASPLPAPHVKDMNESGEFFINRVIKEYKEKDKKHVEFVRSIKALWTALEGYVKTHHTTGVSWNPKGGDAVAAAGSARTGGAPPPPAGGAPPPPPPPIQAPTVAPPSSSSDASNRAELFNALNKGTDISKGLKKVTNDMKTHKNPALRAGPAPFKPATAPKPVAASQPLQNKAAAVKPPVFELQGKKWMVEYQVGNKNIVIDQTETKQVVYIYKCTDSVIIVKNKVNSITLDGCKKCAVVCESLISGMEFVNCASIQCQIQGAVPTVSIDKTDGCQVYMSKDSLHAEIITSKSSEMNILIPKDDGDFTEFPVPQQFKTSWNPKTKALDTIMADL